MNLTTTLQEVKEFLKRGSNKGCKCPACDQYVKVYKRPLNSGMARILIEMYKLGDSEYHHIKDHLRKEGLKNGHDWTLLRFWGMIDPMIKEEEDSGATKLGLWRITDTGKQFVEGKIRVSRRVRIYNKKMLGFEPNEMTTIQDALGDHFSYEQLMM